MTNKTSTRKTYPVVNLVWLADWPTHVAHIPLTNVIQGHEQAYFTKQGSQTRTALDPRLGRTLRLEEQALHTTLPHELQGTKIRRNLQGDSAGTPYRQ